MPTAFWRYLKTGELLWSDYDSVSINQYNSIKKIEQTAKEQIEYFDLNMTCTLSDYSEVELIPDGKNIALTGDNKDLYIKLAKKALVEENLQQYAAIREGVLMIM